MQQISSELEDELDLLELDPEDSLANRIIASFQQSTFDARPQDFLPEDCIDALVTPDAIRRELELDELARENPKFGKQWQNNLVCWVLEHAKRAFAITVQCEHGSRFTLRTLIRFRSSGFNDTFLPIENPRPAAGIVSTSKSWEAFFDPKLWAISRLYGFYEKQWKVLAPVFSPEQYNYDVSSECIFPFFMDGSMPKEGAFASVHRVKIHKSHHKYENLKDVAIKEIKLSRGKDKSGRNKAWEQEARILERINQLDHDHIVKCIAAIRRGDKRYFMFPWAYGDSLRDVWEGVPKQSPSKEIIEQAIVQLRGLADALDRLHHFDSGISEYGMTQPAAEPTAPATLAIVQDDKEEYKDVSNKESIRHGDLKPENILNFSDYGGGREVLGILKIADMGLAKRHIDATQDRLNPTSTRYGTIRYEAPETVTEKNARSRLYDIWSMGCITLEFIIWILYGSDELNNFYNQSKGDTKRDFQYFEVLVDEVQRRAQLHSVVQRWIDHIQNTDPECSQDSAIRDLLSIVQTRLLVVPLPPDQASSPRLGPPLAPPEINETVTNYRASASQFRDALDRILLKMDVPGYVLTGKQRIDVRTPGQKSI